MFRTFCMWDPTINNVNFIVKTANSMDSTEKTIFIVKNCKRNLKFLLKQTYFFQLFIYSLSIYHLSIKSIKKSICI